MAPNTTTMMFAGGIFLPPFEIVAFISNRALDVNTAQGLFSIQLERRKMRDCYFEGIALLNDLAAVGVYHGLSIEKRIMFLTSSAPTTFEVCVGRLSGDSAPDENRMTELVNQEMLLRDISGWSMAQALKLKDISLTVVRF